MSISIFSKNIRQNYLLIEYLKVKRC